MLINFKSCCTFFIWPLAVFMLGGCASQKKTFQPDDFIKAVKIEHIKPLPTLVKETKVIPAHQLRTFTEKDKRKKGKEKPLYSVIEAANAAATRKPDHYGYFNGIMTYDFAEGALYQVIAAPFKITDIQLQPGEELTGKPAIGDKVRWKGGVGHSFKNGKKIQHFFIKPTRPYLHTTLILTTNKRTYHLELHSYKETYMSAISWNYDDDGFEVYSQKYAEIDQENKLIESSLVDISDANLDYTIEVYDGEPFWKPVKVFDNGKKTFIKFPDALAANEAPALYVVRHDDLQMVNYRVKNNYYIVDRLFKKAELRIIQKNGEEIVHIINNNRDS